MAKKFTANPKASRELERYLSLIVVFTPYSMSQRALKEPFCKENRDRYKLQLQ